MPHSESKRPLSDAQRRQRVAAGKASYQALIRRSLDRWIRPDGSYDYDMAARHLTAYLKFHMPGIKNRQRGVTRKYMVYRAIDLGLVVGPAEEVLYAAAPAE